MTLWRLFIQNCRQVVKEWQTRDRLLAEHLAELFPRLKQRIAQERQQNGV